MNSHCLSLRKAHFFLVIVAVCMLVTTSYAGQNHQIPQRAMEKYYDVVREAAPGLDGWTVYRPDDQALIWSTRNKLPVVVWSNGACTISNDTYVYFLTQMAAHGFVVVAFGEPDEHGSPNGIAEADRMKKAMDWVSATPWHGGPWYFNQLDKNKIATAGHSCGGVDAEYMAMTDRRVKTALVLNSGFYPDRNPGDPIRASGPLGYSRPLIPNLYCPILFFNGGPNALEYSNSVDNYGLVTTQTTKPAVLASVPISTNAGVAHSGAYDIVNYRIIQIQLVQTTVEWLDGILNKNKDALQWVIGPNGLNGLTATPGINWTVQSNGF